MRILGRPHSLITPLLTIVLCLVVGFVVSGCGADEPSKKAGPARPQTVDVKLPNELSFQLPEGWATMKSSTAAEAAASSAEFDEMADSMGVTTEQMQQQLAALDVYLTAPRASGGFLDNVNALRTPGPLPTAGSLELQYRSMGATGIEVTDSSTDLGMAHVTTYALQVAGGEIRGGSVAVLHGEDVVVITASTGDDDRTDKLIAQILDTLATDT